MIFNMGLTYLGSQASKTLEFIARMYKIIDSKSIYVRFGLAISKTTGIKINSSQPDEKNINPIDN